MHETSASPSARRALLSSLSGTTVEWYEFFIYGTAAALVFNKLFFPAFDPLIGTLFSLSTFAIAFIARPVGGAIFGHFGDRIGRKSMLVVTLSMMGIATFLIGILPTYAMLGPVAPILLITLRLIQGLSLGGEYSGAVLMSVEHATARRRGLYGAVVNSGAWWGLILANLAFLGVTLLPAGSFETWGWRIPFLLSGILVSLGLYIRLKVEESPEFEKVKRTGRVQKTPLGQLFSSNYRQVILMALSYLSAGATFYVLNVFSLTYGKTTIGLGHGTILGFILATSAMSVVLVPVFGWLSDRVNRKSIYLAAITGMAVLPFLWFACFDTGNEWAILAGYLILGFAVCAYFGTMGAFFAHVFPPQVRYTGLALGYTFGTILGGATAPLIATYLLESTGSWVPIALFLLFAGALSAIASLFLHELPHVEDRQSSPDSAKDEASVEDATL
ncbi:MFS transporter [Rhodococcus jostii]|uniref:MFS transporter n=1 Tax=Rhodococcus jostii TaxID=132919 RepID=UPI003636EE03